MPVNASPATITINHNGFWCDFLNKSSQKASVLPIPYLKNPTTTPAINPTHNACSINLRLLFSPYLILSRFLIDINIILTQKVTTTAVTFIVSCETLLFFFVPFSMESTWTIISLVSVSTKVITLTLNHILRQTWVKDRF